MSLRSLSLLFAAFTLLLASPVDASRTSRVTKQTKNSKSGAKSGVKGGETRTTKGSQKSIGKFQRKVAEGRAVEKVAMRKMVVSSEKSTTAQGANERAGSSERPARRSGARSEVQGNKSSKGSVAGNLGWGSFFSAIGGYGVATGEPLTAAIGFGAGVFNFVKAYFYGTGKASLANAHRIGGNAGWGTFFGALVPHAVASGEPLMVAIGVGATIYNVVKTITNIRGLSTSKG